MKNNKNKGDEMNKPSVFISYNWGSDHTADIVEERLSPIASVYRDKSSIGPWGSISEFMSQIRKTDLAVVIISDAYLKSPACLYEIMQLMKKDNWISHTMFLVEDSAKGIYKATGQLQYICYWENERKVLEEAIKGLNPAFVTSQAEELKKIQSIQLNINDFMKTVTDRNNPDLARAVDAVEKRVRGNVEELKSMLEMNRYTEYCKSTTKDITYLDTDETACHGVITASQMINNNASDPHTGRKNVLYDTIRATTMQKMIPRAVQNSAINDYTHYENLSNAERKIITALGANKLTRLQIENVTGLTKRTVSTVLEELINKGLIKEERQENSWLYYEKQ